MGTSVGLLFNQLSPKAFAKLPWQYYAVFIGCDAVAALCFFTIYPETKGKTLEEIAEIFGDTIAFTEHIGSGATGEVKDIEDTGVTEHAEERHDTAMPKSASVGATDTTA
jgi:hypothetical protein